MTKKASYSEVTNRDLIASETNAALEAINDKFDNTISRDGSTPNNMAADLDLDGNDLLNAGTVNATDIALEGVSLQGRVDAAAASATAAQTAETNAEAAEALAEKWASEDEDVLVSGGLYSAFHYATKSSVSAANSANSDASASSHADAASASLIALGEALLNGLGAFSVNANGHLLISYNDAIVTNIIINGSGDLLITYED